MSCDVAARRVSQEVARPGHSFVGFAETCEREGVCVCVCVCLSVYVSIRLWLLYCGVVCPYFSSH